MAVDREAAHAADAFAAIMIKSHRLLTLLNQLLIDDVQHFEKRSLGGNIPRLVITKNSLCLRITLPPNFEMEVHNLFIASGCKMDALIMQRFLDHFRRVSIPGKMPGRHMKIVLIITQSLAFCRLIFAAEMAAA